MGLEIDPRMFAPLTVFIENLFANWVVDFIGAKSMFGMSLAVIAVTALIISWHRNQRAAKKLGMASLWFIALSFAVAVIAIGAGAYGLGQRTAAASSEETPKKPVAERPAKGISSVKDVHIYAGTFGGTPLNPRFVAKFTRSGQRARLYAEDRYFVAGIMGSSAWYKPPLVLLTDIRDFVVGQTIDVSILTPFENDGRKLWRW